MTEGVTEAEPEVEMDTDGETLADSEVDDETEVDRVGDGVGVELLLGVCEVDGVALVELVGDGD